MQGTEYVPVDANEVMALNEGGGSAPDLPGFEVPGAYINWDRDVGIINRGWTKVLEIPNNPFTHGNLTTVEQIQEIINNEGNLNQIFSEWGGWILPDELTDFIDTLTEYYGVYKPGRGQTDGCIGDRIV